MDESKKAVLSAAHDKFIQDEIWVPFAKLLAEARDEGEDTSAFIGDKNAGRMAEAYRFLEREHSDLLKKPAQLIGKFKEIAFLAKAFRTKTPPYWTRFLKGRTMDSKELKKLMLETLRGMKFLNFHPLETYAEGGKDNLVLYAMVALENNKVELSYENIIIASYLLFPDAFCLPGYEFLPDTSQVKNSIWHNRSKGLIVGKTSENFSLSDKARNMVGSRGDSSTWTAPHPAPKNSKRTEGLLRETLGSPAYKKFKDGQKESISESDFCNILQGTMNSSFDILNVNMQGLKDVAKETSHADLLEILTWLEKKFRFRLTKGKLKKG